MSLESELSDVLLFLGILIVLLLILAVLYRRLPRRVGDNKQLIEDPPDPPEPATLGLVKDSVLQLLGTSALVLTINLGIITFAQSAAVLETIRVQVSVSSTLLAVSIILGVRTMSGLIKLSEGRGNRNLSAWISGFQFWTFAAGLIVMLWAVVVRLWS